MAGGRSCGPASALTVSPTLTLLRSTPATSPSNPKVCPGSIISSRICRVSIPSRVNIHGTQDITIHISNTGSVLPKRIRIKPAVSHSISTSNSASGFQLSTFKFVEEFSLQISLLIHYPMSIVVRYPGIRLLRYQMQTHHCPNLSSTPSHHRAQCFCFHTLKIFHLRHHPHYPRPHIFSQPTSSLGINPSSTALHTAGNTALA